ncbi:MAG: Molybdopterin molybdotransferase [Bacteroidota bacterium]|jgi:molybdopterin molybdotransferase
MISPLEALKIIQQNKFLPKIVSIPLENCFGYQIAEDLYADRDFPPFHRAMMDGIAIQNLEAKQWPIEQTVFAGQPQAKLNHSDACIEIMTGSILPIHCLAIIPFEEIVIENRNEKRMAIFKGENIINEQFIHPQGIDISKNELIISKGTFIQTIEIALAASIGKSDLKVFEKPKIALISTGDEIVAVHQQPLPHQIRSSNMPMLAATLKAKGFHSNTFHLQDSREEIKNKLSIILQNHDILLLSGGVSAGKKDFLPEVLKELAFDCHFHKIAQKPGKPMWFGTRKNDQKTIFALPGNPISTLICFYNYFLPLLLGKENINGFVETPEIKPANAGLDRWFPAKWKIPFQQVEFLPNNGSGDLINWRMADILIWQKAGEMANYLPYVALK